MASIEIPHDNRTIVSFGNDMQAATAGIAKTYWTKAELVVIADNYEQVLWLVPIASFLSSPILIAPSDTILSDLGVKCALVMGTSEPETEEVIRFESREELWRFQLELFDTKGQVCNYVILTNPSDTDDSGNDDIKWPHLSLAAAPLAAFRKAIVQTGDWTTPRSIIEGLETAIEKDNTLYNEARTYFDDVKQDSYAVEKFLMDHGHNPEYLAVVGGPYAVPNYFYDILVNYMFPSNNPQKTVYPSSIGAYAVVQQTVDIDKYNREDLAAGRIMTTSIFDATKLLTKTFFLRDFLPGGKYHSTAPIGWQNRASIVDGHRLNQPEPNNLIWDPGVPYHPANYVKEAFKNASLDTAYYLPRNESDPYDTNKTILEIMNTVTDSSFLQVLPHGGKTSLRIEIGVEPVSGQLKSTYLTGEDVRNLNFPAPTIVYTGCCKGATSFMLDKDLNITEFVTPAFIHAGCVAYIATPEIQSTCFWREAPFGVSTQQTICTWEKLLSSSLPLGKALRDAKWEARAWAMDQWPAENDINGTFDVDGIIYDLYGDPALEPFKPDVPFDTKEDMDIIVSYTYPEAGKLLKISVNLTSFESGEDLTGSLISIKFDGESASSQSTTFTVPNKEGDYIINVSASKEGYHDVNSKYTIHVVGVDADEEDEKMTIILILIIAVMIFIIIIAIVATRIKRK
jgi:hypothetical protein